MKILKIFLFFILFWLQYSLWLGKNGYFNYIKMYKTVLLEEQNNLRMDKRNEKIILRIKQLQNNIKHIKKKCIH
ncbi:MAG: cell division protein FtsB [Buchnera aphidicola (Pentalonia nigronervosa)]|jgi:cell division protein FtsB|uniref:Cell division protein FtsB n=1 Tax=Buchnera aphidicola (Pentalonia nigronervosa) TaxID=1309793 RepID=A0A7H1AYS0_9GAMM|nr:MAG: cell division protein FtsB [Buchnera aphidicola (Pentalonia nigronervosa)]